MLRRTSQKGWQFWLARFMPQDPLPPSSIGELPLGDPRTDDLKGARLKARKALETDGLYFLLTTNTSRSKNVSYRHLVSHQVVNMLSKDTSSPDRI